MDTEVATALNTFKFHGVDIPSVNGSVQIKTCCPFCGKEDHFFISAKKTNAGQFSCKKCGLDGNRYTFLQLFYERRLGETLDSHYKHLGKARGTSHWEAFRNDQWAFDAETKRWIVPVHNHEGSIVNLKVYLGPKADAKWQNTSGCSQHFFGMEQLDKDGIVVLLEGEPDKSMLQYIWPQVDDRKASFLGIPGKDSFPACAKKAPPGSFTNRDIILLFDSGESAAKRQQEAASLLSREYHARSVLCIHWPESYPDNRDVTNLIDSEGKEEAWAKIQSWLRPHNYHAPTLAARKINLDGVIREFRESKVYVNKGFADALITVLAGVQSIRYGGIPLWQFLVDPSGYGKSLILESTMLSPLCHYQTDLKYTTLVSGFKTEPDPSLLSRLNNRVLIVKDWTTILDKNEVQQKELLGLLRDAYDGQVVREFGNGVVRIYPDPSSGQDRCYFGIIAGVTPKIHTFNKTTVGERFLKMSIGRSGVDRGEAVRRAIEGADEPWKEVANAQRRQQAVAYFLDGLESADKPASVSKFTDTLIAISMFSAVARTRPERDRSSGDLLYDAAAESASRLGKQFTKLAQSLASIRGLTTIDGECMRLVRKTAWLTSYGWHRTVYRSLWLLAKNRPTVSEVASQSCLSVSTTARVLMDLRDLGIAEKHGKKVLETSKGGRPADQWRLNEHGRDLVIKSKMFDKT